MNVHDYLIDHNGFNWQELLGPWCRLIPQAVTPWLMNRFGDLFMVYEDGSVNMLDIGGGTVERLADTRDDFQDKIDQGNNANEWLMIPLIDKLVESGMLLGPGQCYGYKQSPVLGGDYTVENTAVFTVAEHYSFHATLHEQIKDLPDGAQVMFVWT